LGSNPATGMDTCLHFLCVVLFCVGRGLTMGRSPVQGVLQTCLKGFIVSKCFSDSEQARGPNPVNPKKEKKNYSLNNRNFNHTNTLFYLIPRIWAFKNSKVGIRVPRHLSVIPTSRSVSTSTEIHVVVLGAVSPCSDTVRHQRFRGPLCPHLHFTVVSLSYYRDFSAFLFYAIF
jgi:hypothetical protein